MIISSASPRIIYLGTQDKSGGTVEGMSEDLPQHLPLMLGFAPKGDTEKTVLNGSGFILKHGGDALDITKPYWTHMSRFTRGALSVGNMVNFKRVVPKDANPPSRITLYADILADDVPNYIRNSDGNIAINPDTNEYLIDEDNPTIPGYRVKYIVEVSDTDLDLGTSIVKNGTMTKEDGDGNTIVSRMYPLKDLKARFKNVRICK